MELIQQKSNGPVAALKATLGRQVIVIPFLFAVLIYKMIKNPDLQTDPFFGLFLGVAVLISLFFAIAYFILQNMSRTDTPVIDRLKRQLASLQRMLLCYRVVYLVAVALLVVFLEVYKNAATAQLMSGWYDTPLSIRIAVYIGLGLFAFFLSRTRFRADFGRHMDEIKKSLSESV